MVNQMQKKSQRDLWAIGLALCANLFIFVPTGFAATYYIRAYDSTKYNGDGMSANWASSPGGGGAWNGPEGAKSAGWTSTVGGGDTVYFIGTFIRERLNRVGVLDIDFPSGSAGNYVVFRGDYPEAPGVLTNFVKDSAADGLHPSKWGFLYELHFARGSIEPLYGDTITNGGTATGFVTHVKKAAGDWASGDASGTLHIWQKSGTFDNDDPIQVGTSTVAHVDGGDATRTETYFNEGLKIYDSRGLFEYFNSISDYKELKKQTDVSKVIEGPPGSYYEIESGAYSGYWVKPYDASNLINNNIRFSYFPGYRLRMDRDGDYIRFYNLSFYGDAPTLNTYHAGGASDYVEWKNIYFWRTPAFLWPAGTFNHWTWTGNVHDGDGFVSGAHIYNTCVNPAESIIDHWIIENSYFSGVHSGSDAHAIGFQGNANNVIIRNNAITDSGSGIVLWKGSCGTQNNFEITYNLIYGLNGSYEGQGRSKCHGIVMQSGASESRDGIVIAHNVLKDPINCDFASDDYHGLGIRTISKSGHQVKVYNNTVINYPVSFEFEGDSRDNDVDFRNNISLNPGYYHVHTNGYSAHALEDHNLYHSSSDNNMWYWDKKGLSFTEYNSQVKAGSGIVVNGASLTGDPGLDDYGRPAAVSDLVADAGAKVGYKYLMDAYVWPQATVGSAVPQISDDPSPDIGAYMRPDDGKISTPTGLRILP